MKKLFMLVVAAVVSAVFATSALAEEQKIVYGKNVGDIMKPMVINTIDGKTVDTGKIEKKSIFVLVNTVCGMCQREMGELEKAKADLGGADLFIVVVDQDASRAEKKYAAFLDSAKLLHDADFKLGENVDVASTPATLVLDKGGKILMKKVGFSPALVKELKELL